MIVCFTYWSCIIRAKLMNMYATTIRLNCSTQVKDFDQRAPSDEMMNFINLAILKN